MGTDSRSRATTVGVSQEHVGLTGITTALVDGDVLIHRAAHSKHPTVDYFHEMMASIAATVQKTVVVVDKPGGNEHKIMANMKRPAVHRRQSGRCEALKALLVREANITNTITMFQGEIERLSKDPANNKLNPAAVVRILSSRLRSKSGEIKDDRLALLACCPPMKTMKALLDAVFQGKDAIKTARHVLKKFADELKFDLECMICQANLKDQQVGSRRYRTRAQGINSLEMQLSAVQELAKPSAEDRLCGVLTMLRAEIEALTRAKTEDETRAEAEEAEKLAKAAAGLDVETETTATGRAETATAAAEAETASSSTAIRTETATAAAEAEQAETASSSSAGPTETPSSSTQAVTGAVAYAQTIACLLDVCSSEGGDTDAVKRVREVYVEYQTSLRTSLEELKSAPVATESGPDQAKRELEKACMMNHLKFVDRLLEPSGEGVENATLLSFVASVQSAVEQSRTSAAAAEMSAKAMAASVTKAPAGPRRVYTRAEAKRRVSSRIRTAAGTMQAFKACCLPERETLDILSACSLKDANKRVREVLQRAYEDLEQKTVAVTKKTREYCLKALRSNPIENLTILESPCEADGQIAHIAREMAKSDIKGEVAIVSSDSDQAIFDTDCTLASLNSVKKGVADFRIYQRTPAFAKLDAESRATFAALVGCDFGPSLVFSRFKPYKAAGSETKIRSKSGLALHLASSMSTKDAAAAFFDKSSGKFSKPYPFIGSKADAKVHFVKCVENSVSLYLNPEVAPFDKDSPLFQFLSTITSEAPTSSAAAGTRGPPSRGMWPSDSVITGLPIMAKDVKPARTSGGTVSHACVKFSPEGLPFHDDKAFAIAQRLPSVDKDYLHPAVRIRYSKHGKKKKKRPSDNNRLPEKKEDSEPMPKPASPMTALIIANLAVMGSTKRFHVHVECAKNETKDDTGMNDLIRETTQKALCDAPYNHTAELSPLSLRELIDRQRAASHEDMSEDEKKVLDRLVEERLSLCRPDSLGGLIHKLDESLLDLQSVMREYLDFKVAKLLKSRNGEGRRGRNQTGKKRKRAGSPGSAGGKSARQTADSVSTGEKPRQTADPVSAGEKPRQTADPVSAGEKPRQMADSVSTGEKPRQMADSVSTGEKPRQTSDPVSTGKRRATSPEARADGKRPDPKRMKVVMQEFHDNFAAAAVFLGSEFLAELPTLTLGEISTRLQQMEDYPPAAAEDHDDGPDAAGAGEEHEPLQQMQDPPAVEDHGYGPDAAGAGEEHEPSSPAPNGRALNGRYTRALNNYLRAFRALGLGIGEEELVAVWNMDDAEMNSAETTAAEDAAAAAAAVANLGRVDALWLSGLEKDHVRGVISFRNALGVETAAVETADTTAAAVEATAAETTAAEAAAAEAAAAETADTAAAAVEATAAEAAAAEAAAAEAAAVETADTTAAAVEATAVETTAAEAAAAEAAAAEAAAKAAEAAAKAADDANVANTAALVEVCLLKIRKQALEKIEDLRSDARKRIGGDNADVTKTLDRWFYDLHIAARTTPTADDTYAVQGFARVGAQANAAARKKVIETMRGVNMVYNECLRYTAEDVSDVSSGRKKFSETTHLSLASTALKTKLYRMINDRMAEEKTLDDGAKRRLPRSLYAIFRKQGIAEFVGAVGSLKEARATYERKEEFKALCPRYRANAAVRAQKKAAKTAKTKEGQAAKANARAAKAQMVFEKSQEAHKAAIEAHGKASANHQNALQAHEAAEAALAEKKDLAKAKKRLDTAKKNLDKATTRTDKAEEKVNDASTKYSKAATAAETARKAAEDARKALARATRAAEQALAELEAAEDAEAVESESKMAAPEVEAKTSASVEPIKSAEAVAAVAGPAALAMGTEAMEIDAAALAAVAGTAEAATGALPMEIDAPEAVAAALPMEIDAAEATAAVLPMEIDTSEAAVTGQPMETDAAEAAASGEPADAAEAAPQSKFTFELNYRDVDAVHGTLSVPPKVYETETGTFAFLRGVDRQAPEGPAAATAQGQGEKSKKPKKPKQSHKEHVAERDRRRRGPKMERREARKRGEHVPEPAAPPAESEPVIKIRQKVIQTEKVTVDGKKVVRPKTGKDGKPIKLKRLPDYIGGAIQITITRTGRMFYMLRRYAKVDDSPREDISISLDPGIISFLTGYTSTGDVISFSDRGDQQRQLKELHRIDRSRADMKEKAKRNGTTCKTRERKLNRRLEKLREQRRTFHQSISRFLCETFKLIILPHFNGGQMSRRRGRTISKDTVRSMRLWDHSHFRVHLINTARRYKNVQLIITDEGLTSKTCSSCLCLNMDLGASRVFKCPFCGFEASRDANAAKNILVRLVRKYFSNICYIFRSRAAAAGAGAPAEPAPD